MMRLVAKLSKSEPGYSVVDYFRAPVLDTEFGTAEDALTAARKAYKGDDADGIGVIVAAVPVDADASDEAAALEQGVRL